MATRNAALESSYPDNGKKVASKDEMLVQLGELMSDMRAESISGRANCNIERQWAEDELFYLGVDAASAADHVDVDGAGATWNEKPMGTPGGGGDATTGSTLFVNITRPFTDAAAARFGDMLIPNGSDRSFSLGPTPVADVTYINENGKLPPHLEKDVRAEIPDPAEQEAAIAEAVANEIKVYQEVAQKAERAQRQIDDWLVECKYHMQVRRAVDQAAQLGTGVLKGPMPAKRTRLYYKAKKLHRRSTMAPIVQYIDVRSCYPDPNCGEDPQNGSYHWERGDMTRRALAALKGLPGVHDDQLRLVLAEGPHIALANNASGEDERFPGLKKRDGAWAPFEVWFGYAALPPEMIHCLDTGVMKEAKRRKKASDKDWKGPVDADDIDWLGPTIDVFCMMVNNRIVRSAHNHLSDGQFPYDYYPWQRVSGSVFGKGVPRQMRPSQRMVVAAVRALMDNAGDAAGLQLVAHLGMIYPADDSMVITRRKLWLAAEDSELDDIRKALTALELPIHQVELANIIEMATRMAEDSTGLPMILQGQQGQAPDTVGGMRILNDNASSVVRRLARQYDDCITEKLIPRMYDYLLLNAEDDSMKGDFQVKVSGSSSMVERDINGQALEKMLPYSKDPVYGIDPRKVASEFIKSLRIDARLVQFDDEEWKAVVEQLAASAQQGAAAADQMKMQIAQLKMDHQTAENQKDREQEQAVMALELNYEQKQDDMVQALEAIKLDLESAKLEAEGVNIASKLKASLAELVISLRTQERLSANKAAGPSAAKPAAEPAGRAPDGQAFAK